MENQQQPQTTLCKAGCGFFGATATEGYCSKCYKDHITRQQDTARISPTLPVPVVMAASPSSSSSSSSSTLGSGSSTSMNGGESSSSSSVNTAIPSSTLSTTTSSLAEKPMTCSQAALSAEDQVAKLESAAATAEVTLSSSSSAVCLDSAAPSPTPDVGPPAKKVNRCGHCKKRVGLTGFSCRCGGLFCGDHRYDTAHACNFDYKTMEREQIAKNNPVCVSDKIQRI